MTYSSALSTKAHVSLQYDPFLSVLLALIGAHLAPPPLLAPSTLAVVELVVGKAIAKLDLSSIHVAQQQSLPGLCEDCDMSSGEFGYPSDETRAVYLLMICLLVSALNGSIRVHFNICHFHSNSVDIDPPHAPIHIHCEALELQSVRSSKSTTRTLAPSVLASLGLQE